MLRLGSMIALAAAGASPEEHVVAHPIAPVFDWNIPTPLGGAESFWFTNHLLNLTMAAVITLLIFIPIGRRYQALMAGVPIERSVPSGFTSLIESLMDALRTGVVRPVLGANTDRFIGFLWTLFFFILINNLLGMIPLEPLVNLGGLHHLFGTATGNVNVTAGLALCAFFMIHFSGVREIYQALVAGTYGHHDDHGEEEHAAAEHEHAAEHGPSMSAAMSFVAAPMIYLYNFAPHVFPVEKRKKSPGITKRIFMILLFAPLIAVMYYAAAGLLVPGGGIEPYAAGVGAAFGVVFALNAGGIHPLDFADAVMWGFLVPLEFIGAIVKPFALCMRLFANMIAGHMVLAAILLLIPVFTGLTAAYLATSLTIAFGCVLLSGLELFVAFLQAYIFMFLTTMFIGAAVHPEH